MERGEFVSLLTEGRAALASSQQPFGDARVEAIRRVRYDVDDRGEVAGSDLCRIGMGVRVVEAGKTGLFVSEGTWDWSECVAHAHQLMDHSVNSDEFIGAARVEPIDNTIGTLPHISAVSPDELRSLAAHVREHVVAAEAVRTRYLCKMGWFGVVNSEGTRALRPVLYRSVVTVCSLRTASGKLINLPIAERSVGPTDLLPVVRAQIKGEIHSLAEELGKSTELSPRRVPVVLGPAMSGLLIHEAFGHICEADRIPAGRHACLPLGIQLGPDELEVSDSGLTEGACGSIEFHDEGTSCIPAPLIARGRWIGLLHSRTTAMRFGVTPTGNARVASFRFSPLCRMRVTKVKAGTSDPGDLLRGIEDGVYLDLPHGGHLRGGKLRIGALVARRILKGKLGAFFAGALLETEPLNVLRLIEAIGNDEMLTDRTGECTRDDQKNLPVSTIAPSLRVREATILPL